MNFLQINQLSYWEIKHFFSEIELVIIGSGIVGYNCALSYREINPNAKILILERGYLPSGASTKNAGFACFGSASELISDLNTISEQEVFETVEKRWRGLQKLRTLIGDKEMRFIQNGSWDLFNSESDADFKECKEQIDYLNQQAKTITGEKDVFSIENSAAKDFGFENWDAAIKNKLEGQIDTGHMMLSLHKKAVENNILLLNGIEFSDYSLANGKVYFKTNIGEFQSEKLAICTNGLTKLFMPEIDLEPARAQVLITNKIEDLKVNGTFHFDAGFYYFRNIDQRILFGGGRNLDISGETTTQFANTAQIISHLTEILRENILPDTNFEVAHSWSGIMGLGKSKNPIVKKIDDQIAIGVKLGGMGVAIGSLIGAEVAELLND